ncbi:MAG: hypothetical protein HQM00_12295 [Magnetococcales bacterium]|nr:hypothetical protein [Magnetococcales bacterium]
MIQKEKETLNLTDGSVIGLGLSGGGIRSAAFNLGVLQSLQVSRWMERIHYLSTVSGGGYIGAAYSWFKYVDRQSTNNFPFGLPDTPTDDHKHKRVSWIRNRGNYLTPTSGLNTWALLAAIFRGIFINLLILLPIVLTIMAILTTPTDTLPLKNIPWISEAADWIQSKARYCPDPSCILTTPESNAVVPDCIQKDQCRQLQIQQHLSQILIADYILLLGTGLAVLFLAAYLIYALMSWKEQPYSRRLWANKKAGSGLWITLALIVLGLMPYMDQFMTCWLKTTSLAALMGIISTIKGWFGRKNNNEGQGWRAWAIGIGTILASYFLLLWIFHGALIIWAEGWDEWQIGLSLGAAALSLLTGSMANINLVSMHRFYRDRLREAFMPSHDEMERNHPIASRGPNSIHPDIFSLNALAENTVQRPYHIINTTLNTITSENPKWAGRGGDNFIFSPLFCGSDATGYRTTQTYADQKFTLATAFTISGAAVDPNNGVTRFGPLSFLMAMLNIRLGYWSINPQREIPKQGRSVPRWLPAILKEMLQNRLCEDRKYVHLADGGHFENLGAYELIRRRCDLIIISDAGADPGNTFDSLGNLINRARVDFGTEITIDTLPMRPEDQLSDTTTHNKTESSKEKKCCKQPHNEPESSKGKKFCERPYLIGTIHYPEKTINGQKSPKKTGCVLYINTCLFKEVPQCVLTYQRMNKDFPEQTTADQFFDEAQFEAYRELGFHAVKKMVQDLSNPKPETMPQPDPVACKILMEMIESLKSG